MAPSGVCNPGYYCTGGSVVPTQHEAKPGYYTLSGAKNMSECAPGTFNSRSIQSVCLGCEAGYYCPSYAMKTFDAYICPEGNFCPQNSSTPQNCPPGTFSPINKLGNVAVSSCTSCLGGFYCSTAALLNVTGPCNAGYYCIRGASSKIQAVKSSTGGPCPVGNYCPTGSRMPLPCPRGTYMPLTRNNGSIYYLGVNFFCDLCPRGKSCSTSGLTTYDGGIEKGYWSTVGAYSSRPICSTVDCINMYGFCPVGSYCPQNVSIPIECPQGYYQDKLGQSSCMVSVFRLCFIF